MDQLRKIIREQIQIILKDDKKPIDFGPAYGSTVDKMIKIKDIYDDQIPDSEKLKRINEILEQFF